MTDSAHCHQVFRAYILRRMIQIVHGSALLILLLETSPDIVPRAYNHQEKQRSDEMPEVLEDELQYFNHGSSLPFPISAEPVHVGCYLIAIRI